MTRDDIIKLMQKACDSDKKPAWHNEFWTITQEELERFANLVAEAEREECAKMLEDFERFGDTRDCVAAIRARGNT
jgi:hypothetical protein